MNRGCDAFCLGFDAVYKILSAKVPFTRPRKCHNFTARYALNIVLAAYGEYNDLTVEVATARNQKLVTWTLSVELLPSPIRHSKNQNLMLCS